MLKGQDLSDLTISDVYAAEKRLRELFAPSPLISMEALNTYLGHKVWMKADSLLPTGAFKIRGAYNTIMNLVEKHGKDTRVVTASSGNHGMAVAYSSKCAGIKATVAVPVTAPQMKKDIIKSFGAELVEHGITYDETFPEACRISEETGAYYVHSVSDVRVIAGQGTISKEILDNLWDIEQIVIPLGGAGLTTGVAFTAKTLKPDIKVTCSMPAGSDVYAACRRAGRIVELDKASSIADAVLKKSVEDYLYPYVEKYVDDIVTVEEHSIMEGIKAAALYGKLVLEGAGALGIAAVLEGKVDINKKTVIICSGGNIDALILKKCFG